jgi:hypothetical protein
VLDLVQPPLAQRWAKGFTGEARGDEPGRREDRQTRGHNNANRPERRTGEARYFLATPVTAAQSFVLWARPADDIEIDPLQGRTQSAPRNMRLAGSSETLYVGRTGKSHSFEVRDRPG